MSEIIDSVTNTPINNIQRVVHTTGLPSTSSNASFVEIRVEGPLQAAIADSWNSSGTGKSGRPASWRKYTDSRLQQIQSELEKSDLIAKEAVDKVLRIAREFLLTYLLANTPTPSVALNDDPAIEFVWYFRNWRAIITATTKGLYAWRFNAELSIHEYWKVKSQDDRLSDLINHLSREQ